MKTYYAVIVLLASVLFGLVANAEEAVQFDHFQTGFPLDGMHRLVECNDCHQDGRFKGTPMQCEGCHADRSKVNASVKNLSHINSTDRCENCHLTAGWETVIRVDHSEVRGVCNFCHNGIIATGTSVNHIPIGPALCDACHSNNFWSPAFLGR